MRGDLFDALPDHLRGRVDLLIANTPYVPSGEIPYMPPEARDHEPRHTLDGGPDGLALLRRIAADAATWLAPGGQVLIEVGEGQVEAASSAYRASRLAPRVRADTGTGATVVVGRYAGS